MPWRRKWQPTPVLLPGKSQGQRSLVGYSPWDRKESDTTEWLHFHFLRRAGDVPGGSVVKNQPANAEDEGSQSLGLVHSLEEDTATHSSILAWRNPWREESGGLQSMGLQRVRCVLAIKQELETPELTHTLSLSMHTLRKVYMSTQWEGSCL